MRRASPGDKAVADLGTFGVAPAGIAATPGGSRSLGAHIWRCAAGGGRHYAAVHLGQGLHAQSGACPDLAAAVRALAALLRARARRRCLAAAAVGSRSEGAGGTERPKDARESEELFAWSVTEALREASSSMKLYLRARTTFARGLRLSTPLRTAPAAALRDWHRLCSPRLGALQQGTGSAPRRLVWTPEAAAAQWARTCEAWVEIWSECGHQGSELRSRLAAMEAVWRPSWARVAHRWRGAQQAAVRQIARLLEREARRDAARHRRHVKVQRSARAPECQRGRHAPRAETGTRPAAAVALPLDSSSTKAELAQPLAKRRCCSEAARAAAGAPPIAVATGRRA
uniref:Uncharacterized protein n=1 Tax=Alexandrium monilatum TaxID=311494 RepID=A0A7S4ULT2_9DINO